MIIAPFGACIAAGRRLSTLTIVGRGGVVRLRAHAAAPCCTSTIERPCADDVVFEFVPEMAQKTLHRPRRGFAEGTDGVAFDLARGALQHVQVVERGLAIDDARQHAVHPAGAFAARRALAAGLGIVEARDALAARAPCRWCRP
jgi:hypothetical protein